MLCIVDDFGWERELRADVGTKDGPRNSAKVAVTLPVDLPRLRPQLDISEKGAEDGEIGDVVGHKLFDKLTTPDCLDLEEGAAVHGVELGHHTVTQ